MSVLIKDMEMPKNCEKCRWYKQTYPVYTFGEFSARCCKSRRHRIGREVNNLVRLAERGRRKMSANRETIAKVLDIPTEQVKCANCIGHNEFINGMFYCDVWDLYTMEDVFCSFFAKEVEDG